MTNTPEEPKRRSAYERFHSARKWFWSTWTEEAVAVYRRTTEGKHRAKMRMVEFLLFLREIIREFYKVEVTARAASLAYTTLLSLIPLLVALSTLITALFQNANVPSRVDWFLNLVIPYQAHE